MRRSTFWGVSRCLTRFDPEDRKSRRLSVEAKQFALLVPAFLPAPQTWSLYQSDVYGHQWWLLGGMSAFVGHGL
jgi:hypothetical protein